MINIFGSCIGYNCHREICREELTHGFLLIIFYYTIEMDKNTVRHF